MAIPRFGASYFDYGMIEIAAAVAVAAVVQLSLFLHAGGGKLAADRAKTRAGRCSRSRSRSSRSSTKPPLLKLGGKKRAKLPDMWKKQAAVQRFEDRSAPSPKRQRRPTRFRPAQLATTDAQAPPPDAEIAKQVDEDMKLIDAQAPEPQVAGEGVADGVKEGTEADPLKGRAVSLYRAKIIAWFNARFRPPVGEIPCEELKKLSSRVSGVRLTGWHSDRIFGRQPERQRCVRRRVQSAMQGTVGQQVPPPPPLYPDILPPNVSLNFMGSSAKCE